MNDVDNGSWRDIWYFIKTGQWQIHVPIKEDRAFGYWYDWYDGPHYCFGFYLFYVSLSGFKDHAKGMKRYRFIKFIERLIK